MTVDDPKLGRRGDVIKAASGYAYNYLIPSRRAKLATPSSLKSLEMEKSRLFQRERELRAKAEALALKLRQTLLTIPAASGESGKLFGAVTHRDIQEALLSRGISLDKKDIHLAEPIRRLGDHEISLKLHPDVQLSLKISVVKKA